MCLAKENLDNQLINKMKNETKMHYLGIVAIFRIRTRGINSRVNCFTDFGFLLFCFGWRGENGSVWRIAFRGLDLARSPSLLWHRGSLILVLCSLCMRSKRLWRGFGALNVLDWGLSRRLNQDIKATADLCANDADCLSNRMFRHVCFKKSQVFFKACLE